MQRKADEGDLIELTCSLCEREFPKRIGFVVYVEDESARAKKITIDLCVGDFNFNSILI